MTDDLTETTVTLLSALLDSASVDVIGVSNWWPRAQSSLETAAAGAESAGQAVTIAARKLQIDVLSADSARTVAHIAPLLDAAWSEWTHLVSRDAVYIVALTRVHREQRRTAKAKIAPTPTAQLASEEII